MRKDEAKALRNALDYGSALEVLEAGDNLTNLVPWLNTEGRRIVIGCAFIMGVAAGKRQERARHKKEVHRGYYRV